MTGKSHSVRWWLTTTLAGLLGSQIVLGCVLDWPFWVIWLLLLALGLLLSYIERQNENATDFAQIWWVPTRVLWATPSRAVQSGAMVVVGLVVVGFVVFGDVSLWPLWIVVVGTLVHRVVNGRRWLKRDLEAQKAVEDSEE